MQTQYSPSHKENTNNTAMSCTLSPNTHANGKRMRNVLDKDVDTSTMVSTIASSSSVKRSSQRLRRHSSSAMSMASSPGLSSTTSNVILRKTVRLARQRVPKLVSGLDTIEHDGEEDNANGNNVSAASLNNSVDTTFNSISAMDEDDGEHQSPRKQQRNKLGNDVGILRILARVPDAVKNHRDSRGRRGGFMISNEAIVDGLGSSLSDL